MRINVISKDIEITDAIRQYAESKTDRLTKYFDGIQQITVRVAKNGHTHSAEYEVELILEVVKHADFVSHASGKDAYAAIDLVAEKGERQLRDFKETLKQGKH